MAAAEHFDVVVVGRSLAGLLTAALLARRKRRVLAIDCAGAPPLERPPLFGDTARLVVRVLDELGLQHSMRTRLEGAWGPVTVALPDRRFVLAAEEKARAHELGEVLPGRIDALLDVFERIERYGPSLDGLLDGELALPEAGWRAKRAWSRAWQDVAAARLVDRIRWTDDPLVRSMLAALLRVAGHTDDARGPMTVRTVRSLWHLTHGIVPMRGGRAGFARMVSEKLDILGGQIDGRRAAQSLGVRRKKIHSVVTADGKEIGADVVILAGGAPDLSRLWPEAPPYASVAGRRMGVRVAAADRPVDLRDPCGWVADADGPAHMVRVAGDRLVVSWVGRGTPPLARLVPFARLDNAETVSVPYPAPSDDPLSLLDHPIRGPLKNLLFVGEWIMPGLGLEGACFTAWHAAAAAERIGPRRR